LLKSKSAPREYARILSNLAYTKWLNDSSYRPAPELWAALQIRKREHDDWGVSASFIHLSDFYTHTRNDSALFYAYQLYNLSKKLRSPDEKLNAISMLIRSEKPGIAQQYFQQYEPLADSIQVARNRAKNQFALIRYETEKYKADKLKLQKENAESKLRIIWWQLALLIGSIIVIIGFILYRRKKQQAIREQQLKTSQKVHDIVANGLYSIIKRIEYGQELEKNQLLDDMDILYEQSRNISYEHPQEITPQTEDQLPSFLKSFATPGTSISIAGYSTALWKRLQPRTQNEVKLAFQNLMINMQKHSQAKNVVIKFERLNQELKIAYTDDGVGLPKNFRYGNGLSSTENRIRSIGGRIIFDSDPGKGLKIQLFIPTE
jgi:signal transduction histidine kinase